MKVTIYIFVFFISTLLLGKSPDLHDDDPIPNNKTPVLTPDKGNGGVPLSKTCSIPGGSLYQFATGENYDLPSMVTFLTQPECIENNKTIAATEMVSEGIKFNATTPINLSNLTKGLSPRDYDALRRLDDTLTKTVPEVLRSNPLSQGELLPLVGQLSLLSPKAARFGMVKLMEQELFVADPILGLENSSQANQKQAAKTLAINLVKLGAREPILIDEFATNVEDMATLSLTYSLIKVFRGLAKAAEVEASLAALFNASASALNRGVTKAASITSKNDASKMLQMIFTAVVAAGKGNESLVPGNQELDEAISFLIQGKPIQKTALKGVWKEILRVLATSQTQVGLAKALSISLTPDMAFLPDSERRMILEAAAKYPEIAFAIQDQSLLAIQDLKMAIREDELSVEKFNEMKLRSLDPLVSQVLTWETFNIHPVWIRAVSRLGFINEEDCEKRLPRHVLSMVQRSEEDMKKMNPKGSVEQWIEAAGRQFVLDWTLHQAYIPTLTKWVKAFEEKEETDSLETK